MGLMQSQAITKVAETIDSMGIRLGDGEKYDGMATKLETPWKDYELEQGPS